MLVTGEYPQGIRDYLVAVFGCGLRVEAYAGRLTGPYPPFGLGRWLGLLVTKGA